MCIVLRLSKGDRKDVPGTMSLCLDVVVRLEVSCKGIPNKSTTQYPPIIRDKSIKSLPRLPKLSLIPLIAGDRDMEKSRRKYFWGVTFYQLQNRKVTVL